MNEPKKHKKILFLYFELAGYVKACLDTLARLYPVEIHLVRYPVVQEAPFKFSFGSSITLYERESFDDQQLIELVRKINPDFLFVSGWADKGYLKAARHLRKRIPVVLSLDNPWRGTLKQYIACLIGPLFLPQIFTHCWVPGEPNAKYARRLGFQGERLLTGMYAADTVLFNGYADSIQNKKTEAFPHRFLYLGRYVEAKGIRELWAAFQSLSEEERKDWELWCIGSGQLLHEFPRHSSIRDIGFIQPEELCPYLEQCGVFILPAHYEHWGVVVHEMAAAGFPLICTETVSAASAFLEDGKNGFTISSVSISSIKEALLKTIALDDKELCKMGRHSRTLASSITPETWAAQIWNLSNSE